MTKLKAEDVDGIPVVCEPCGRVLTRHEVSDAKYVVDNHNDKRHDGDDVAYFIEDVEDVDTSKAEGGQRDKFLQELVDLVR